MIAVKIHVFIVLNLIDLVCAVVLYGNMGVEFELNPIAKILLINFGILGAVALKLVAVGFALFTVYRALCQNRNRMAHGSMDVFIGLSTIGATLSVSSFL